MVPTISELLTPKRALSSLQISGLRELATRRAAASGCSGPRPMAALYVSNMENYSRASCWCITIFVATSRRKSARMRVQNQHSHVARAARSILLPRSNAGWVFVGCKRVSIQVPAPRQSAGTYTDAFCRQTRTRGSIAHGESAGTPPSPPDDYESEVW